MERNTELKAEKKSINHSVMSGSATPWTVARQTPLSMKFSRQEYWSSHSLFQGIFSTQGLSLGPLQCGQIIYHLSHQGSPHYKYMKSQSTQSNGLLVVDLWGTE